MTDSIAWSSGRWLNVSLPIQCSGLSNHEDVLCNVLTLVKDGLCLATPLAPLPLP